MDSKLTKEIEFSVVVRNRIDRPDQATEVSFTSFIDGKKHIKQFFFDSIKNSPLINAAVNDYLRLKDGQ